MKFAECIKVSSSLCVVITVHKELANVHLCVYVCVCVLKSRVNVHPVTGMCDSLLFQMFPSWRLKGKTMECCHQLESKGPPGLPASRP